MAHRTNLMVQTLSHLQMGNEIEGLLQTLSNYFSKSLKRHLEFTKLTKLMETKGAKTLNNVKTHWISMLSLARCVMAKYKILLMKMALDDLTNEKKKTNFDFFAMCKFYWGLVPFSYCCSISIT